MACTSPSSTDDENATTPAIRPAVPAAEASSMVETLLPAPERPNRCSNDPMDGFVGAPPSPQVSGVLLVSIDGLATRHVEDLMAKGMVPAFDRLIQEGASTYNARTNAGITVTIPNHTSMISGRPALPVPGFPEDTHHGVQFNDDTVEGEVLHGQNPGLAYLPSIFDEIHDRSGYTGLFTGKDKFEVFQRSYSAPYGRADAVAPDDGVDKLDDFLIEFDAAVLVPDMLAKIEAGPPGKPDSPWFAMLHFRDTDAIGHASGWDSHLYVEALLRVDRLLQDVLDAFSTTSAFANTAILVTTDHGGFEFTHDDITDPRIHRIPFFAWGAGVPQGVDLYAASGGTRFDPGTASPPTETDAPPVRNGDAANLALWLMGLPPITGSLHQGMSLSMPLCEGVVPSEGSAGASGGGAGGSAGSAGAVDGGSGGGVAGGSGGGVAGGGAGGPAGGSSAGGSGGSSAGGSSAGGSSGSSGSSAGGVGSTPGGASSGD